MKKYTNPTMEVRTFAANILTEDEPIMVSYAHYVTQTDVMGAKSLYELATRRNAEGESVESVAGFNR